MKQIVLFLFMVFALNLASAAQSANGVTLQPNPVEDRATLTFDQPINGDVTLTVRDLTGKTILSFRPDTEGEECFRVPLEFENLRKGIYILQVMYSNGKVKTLRFQKT